MVTLSCKSCKSIMAFSRGKINIQMAFHAFLKKDHSILIIGFYGSVDNLSKVFHRFPFFFEDTFGFVFS